MSELKKHEAKLLNKMIEKSDSKIQFIMANKDKSLMVIGDSEIEAHILLMAYYSNKKWMYIGFGSGKLQTFHPEEGDIDVRFFIDRTDEENRKFYLTYNDEEKIFSEGSEPDSDEAIIFYFETKNIAQLTIFNNALDPKVAELSAASPRSIKNIRNICRNFIKLTLPWKNQANNTDNHERSPEMDGDRHEKI